MLWTVATLALLCQDPQVDRELPTHPQSVDVVKLLGGEEIRGRILKQVGNYIEIDIGGGTIVGFERSRVERIVRGIGASSLESSSAISAHDDWFLLSNSDGISVGYLHETVQVQENGEIHIGEEWAFQSPQGKTQVTFLEVVESDLRPRQCFYHERVIGADDRLLSEQILDARIEGPELVVNTRSLKARLRKTYPFSSVTTFPLVFAQELRQKEGAELLATSQELFDPKSGEFRVIDASTLSGRRVELDGKQMKVKEITLNDGSHRNVEWVDTDGRVVWRQVNGLALVALRVSEQVARRSGVRRAESRDGSAVVATASGRLAVWRPSPIWRAGEKEEGGVSIDAPLYEGQATLFELDQIPANVQLVSAADSVVRWLQLLLGEDLRVLRREGVQVRRKPALRLVTTWSTAQEGQVRYYSGHCYVFSVENHYVALFCRAPKESFAALEADFERILHTVQLNALEIEPPLQGPLARPDK